MLRASFVGRKIIPLMSHDFFAIRKIVAEPMCESLAKCWTFFGRTQYGSYVCCTIILQLTPSMLSAISLAIWLRLTADRKSYDKKCVRLMWTRLYLILNIMDGLLYMHFYSQNISFMFTVSVCNHVYVYHKIIMLYCQSPHYLLI